MRRLAGISSPSLIEVVPQILGPSQNWMTEQLVRTLGAELGELGSWPEGFSVIQRFLEEEGRVRSEDVHWEDGSGLSNHNLITPRALVSILRYARDQSWGEAFRSGLAQPGLEGTTLASRLPELRGRAFAKTGSLSHVNSLSGYVFADDGRELIFAILTNGSNLPASQVRAQIDAVVVELLRD
jgi:D-alanyl-D-alanine carboxypeptidase/D-alanyl-D-alanine-endopeptidase (penicillin-binding protein 4)